MTTTPDADQQSIIRSRARAARAALSSAERANKSAAITRRLSTLQAFKSAGSVGLYRSTPEEVNTGDLLSLCRSEGKHIYLPVIRPGGHLVFAPFNPGITELEKNRFGIEEPSHAVDDLVEGMSLDLVIAPLVAFTQRCDRIGMGGGYYDRAFGERSFDEHASEEMTGASVCLVGVAFDCQASDFRTQPHDVAMDAIVTESAIFCRPGIDRNNNAQQQ